PRRRLPNRAPWPCSGPPVRGWQDSPGGIAVLGQVVEEPFNSTTPRSAHRGYGKRYWTRFGNRSPQARTGQQGRPVTPTPRPLAPMTLSRSVTRREGTWGRANRIA